ncbi:iron ABC transporter permease [Clostridium sp. KNHs214]|uniref:FecCD family ABC transporter permease n=1 Tax=Clostridium sp. KNHs214 TaxID=1540257 RepID=UPI00068C14CF|nr:iron ABC transporter permease [Clostridium sp. KNHs214]
MKISVIDTEEFCNAKDEFYAKFTKRKMTIVTGLFILLIFIAIVSICVGTVSLSFKETVNIIISNIFNLKGVDANALNNTVVMKIRFPRVLAAIIIGSSLAATGAVMQGILRNPLVSPYTLGLSSGSAFGAALAIVLGTSIFGSSFIGFQRCFVVISAFVFGLITMLLVYFIARVKGLEPGTLILSGVAIGYVFSALVSILKYVSNNEQLGDIVFWTMGGLWQSKWSTLSIIFPITLVCNLLMIKYAWDLNALGSGDEVAVSLGINVNKVRIICLVLCALSASSCVAFAGTIGFIGLVAPHISRIIIGSDYRFLIPCSSLMGALILLFSDTLARTVISPTEIPVGIITSLLGAPFFIYLLIKKRR